jgi:hypothetical protein
MRRDGKRENWLLIKCRDREARVHGSAGSFLDGADQPSRRNIWAHRSYSRLATGVPVIIRRRLEPGPSEKNLGHRRIGILDFVSFVRQPAEVSGFQEEGRAASFPI